MTHLVIAGVPPYDGRYPLDLEREFTTREWGWLKRFAGYLPMNIEDGFAGADPELFAVFALIALRRAGRLDVKEAQAVFDQIADAPFGSAITLEGDEEPAEDDDAGPPPQNSGLNGPISGADSQTNSASPAESPNATGGQPSAISALAPATSPS